MRCGSLRPIAMVGSGDHPLHPVLGRFPWRRRKPRAGRGRARALEYVNRGGRVVYSSIKELVDFEDPGPALAFAVLHGDINGQTIVAELVEHHAAGVGVELPDAQSERTRAGLRVLKQLMMKAGLDPKTSIGGQPLEELLAVTWALGAVVYPDVAS
ncbi:MAG: hypothetical protein H6713_08265 [Myxococcales bacterium]|nr:hypothetical protein [Myxococcales bacterium]